MKYIFKYLRITRNYMLTYGGSYLISVGYIDSDFMSNIDSRKSVFGYVFTIRGSSYQLKQHKATVYC